MADDITTKPGDESAGGSPSGPSHLPDPGEWPGNAEDQRESTEYTQPPGEREAPGGREAEQSGSG
jgi:hypothetical protein